MWVKFPLRFREWFLLKKHFNETNKIKESYPLPQVDIHLSDQKLGSQYR